MVRDAVWKVVNVRTSRDLKHILDVVGLSPLVRDRSVSFVREIEEIKVLKPEKTRLVPDRSPGHRASLLRLEAMLRDTAPDGSAIAVGHRAAMDVLDFQLEPARIALARPFQRILIADAVGLGKTLEAGILCAELIRRGRGRRILVVTTKSMLEQFQREFWHRFTIPLVRLDSAGIQRIRREIPANHNPFNVFEKTIISIDTLKQAHEYGALIDRSHWDIVVIDEAHNVARRKGGGSYRAQLAEKLAHRCSDTLILLSATPHDGSPESFASLMQLLDPTALPDDRHYGKEDIRGLYVRRFRHDPEVQAQIRGKVPTPDIAPLDVAAGPDEEAALAAIDSLELPTLDRGRSTDQLFRVALLKSFYSSPQACLQTLQTRLRTLERRAETRLLDPGLAEDIERLREVERLVLAVVPSRLSRYRRLLELIREWGWSGDDPEDRLVIFTERLETMRWLAEALPRDLGLPDRAVVTVDGSMGDLDLMRVVREFGRTASPLRLVVASDVASEGLNLHYLCHRLVHFDVPWSFMSFQQRNGRIDRYGQARQPLIRYLVTRSADQRIDEHARVLSVLIRKDERARKNIGDPSVFLGAWEASEQEAVVGKAIGSGTSGSDFEAELDARAEAEPDDFGATLEALLAEATAAAPSSRPPAPAPSLVPDDFTFFRRALEAAADVRDLALNVVSDGRLIELLPPEDLIRHLRQWPQEARPERGARMRLTADKATMLDAMRAARSDEDGNGWADVSWLWPLHPAMRWAVDKLVQSVERHAAPVIDAGGLLNRDEAVFVVRGTVPNRRGQVLLARWYAARFEGSRFARIEPLAELIDRLGLRAAALPNRSRAIDLGRLQALLPVCVAEVANRLEAERKAFDAPLAEQIREHAVRLESLRERHQHQLELRFEGLVMGDRRIDEKTRRARQIEDMIERFRRQVRDALTTEPGGAHLEIAAVMAGEGW